MSSTSAPGPPPAGRRPFLLAAVLAVCALLYFLDLGGVAFLGKDEPKNAQTAREMYDRGDWVTTTLAGEPWYDKPILSYWTAILAYHALGPGELGARLGPALAAMLAVLLTFLLGRRILGGDGAGALAALVLGTGLEFFWFARTAVTDALLTACVMGAMTAYLFAREGVSPARNLYLAYAFTGLAALAKGPIGLLLPAMVIGADILIARDWSQLRRLRLLPGMAIFLGVAGPWYSLVMIRSEGQFFRDFILHYNLERFATENLPHAGPFYYYLPVLLAGPFPWSAFLPTATIRVARGFRTLEARDRARMRFLVLWVAVPLVFFSFAGSKLPSYLLPIFPALAILLAGEIRHLVGTTRGQDRRALTVAVVLFAVVAGGLAAGAWLYLGHHLPAALPGALPLCLVLGATAVGSIVALLAGWRRIAVGMVGAAAILAPLAIVGWGLEPAEDAASAREIAEQAMALDPGPGELLSFRFYDNSFFFYTNSRVERVYDPGAVEERAVQKGSVLCFVRRHDLPEVRDSRRTTVEELGVQGKIHLLRLTRRPEPGGEPEASDG